VQAHGGRCWVEETPGGGATFVIALPFDSGEIDAIDETLRQVPATGGVPVSP